MSISHITVDFVLVANMLRFVYCELYFVLALRPGGKHVATCNCRLRPSGNCTVTFAVNHNFIKQILEWSIGESM